MPAYRAKKMMVVRRNPMTSTARPATVGPTKLPRAKAESQIPAKWKRRNRGGGGGQRRFAFLMTGQTQSVAAVAAAAAGIIGKPR